MSDPLTLIATGAAVGGAAGKFAEKAWDYGERWVSERFHSHIPVAQEIARENAARFVHQLAIRVAELEQKSPSIGRAVSRVPQEPQFSALLQQSILNAAQTSDEQKSELLADLVAKRLLEEEESTEALASSLSSDAIARANRPQLRLMALCTLIDVVRPRNPYPTVGEFKQWLEVHFKPFEHFEFEELDAKHLVAIGCASYNPTSERSLEMALTMKAGLDLIEKIHDDDFSDVDSLRSTQIGWGLGLAGIPLRIRICDSGRTGS